MTIIVEALVEKLGKDSKDRHRIQNRLWDTIQFIEDDFIAQYRVDV